MSDKLQNLISLLVTAPALLVLGACGLPPEVCDGYDNDLDGFIDEGIAFQPDGVSKCSNLFNDQDGRFQHGGGQPTPIELTYNGDTRDVIAATEATPTQAASPTFELTPTPTAAPTPTAVPTPTFTGTPTQAPSPTPTWEETPSPTEVWTPTPTTVETPTATPAPTPTLGPFFCEGLVTRGQGFWKNHPCVVDGDATGRPLVPVSAGESLFLNDAAAVSEYLGTPVQGQTQIQLGRALITAKLNLGAFDVGHFGFEDWDGDGRYETVEELVLIADNLYDVGSSSKQNAMAEILQDFNEYGEGLPLYFDPKCEDDVEACDGQDDDSDGEVDEGCACPAE